MKNSTNLISKLTTSCIINEVVNTITEDVIFQLNKLDGTESDFYYQTLEYVEGETENFKAELFLAIKEIFTRRELILLQKSNTDSRNYLIAYHKLCDLFKSELKIEDMESLHMTTDEMYAMLFEFMSNGYEDRFAPNKHLAETKAEKERLPDYNSINEMFTK